jgi:hypothetical protein
MQPEDVTDLQYRPVDGDTKQLSQKLEAVTMPSKSLKEIGDTPRREGAALIHIHYRHQCCR